MIYSDSTVWHVNQLALSTDVACMSCGGIGQFCNGILLDVKHEEVVLVAINNEAATDNDSKGFVYTIQAGI